jgi:predicted nucleic acid-binding protein
MRGKVFLDTNVLIYAATSLEPFPDKFARAAEIIAKEEFGISRRSSASSSATSRIQER